VIFHEKPKGLSSSGQPFSFAHVRRNATLEHNKT
jgi:hypothetical protein